MNQLKFSDIKALFEHIAKTHPLIGHDPAAKVNRFYGFNLDELDAARRSKLNWQKLVMGLSYSEKSPVTWRFQVHQMAIQGSPSDSKALFRINPVGSNAIQTEAASAFRYFFSYPLE